MVHDILDLEWILAIAALVAVLGVGRWSRLVTYDTFPPAVWLRGRWAAWTDKSDRRRAWGDLLFCPWCFTPWLMLICIGWFLGSIYVTWLAWAWWLLWTWGALSYVASMVLARDEPAS